MYYSVIQLKGPMILTEDSFGDLQVFSREFFDYDVQENDVVYLKDGMFHYAEDETKRIQQQNHERIQELSGK